jgi:FkbM family methyltransferase
MVPIKIIKAARAFVHAQDRRALLQGVVASYEHSTVLAGLPSASTVIDIGANKGQFILEAIKWHPDAQYIAFEPLKTERAVMARVLKGIKHLTIHPIALGAAECRVPIYVSAAPDSSSVLRQAPLQSECFPGTHNIGLEEIVMRRCDVVIGRSQLRAPVVCKIDVQGYELNVLQGFGGLLQSVDYLIVELTNAQFYDGAPNSAEVIAFLAAHGFRVAGLYDMYIKDGICLQADFLFHRN